MKSRGFTLIELIITIAILAIIVSIAAPSFHSTIQSQHLNRDAKDLAMLLSEARNQAVTLRNEVTVHLGMVGDDENTAFYWMPHDSNALDQSTSIDQLIFLPNGTLKDRVSSATTISICNLSMHKTKNIEVSRMGSVQFIAEGACS